MFVRFKALLMEPAAFTYTVRHDNIEAIYKKLKERRDTADVTALLKDAPDRQRGDPHAGRATDHAEGLTIDLSQLDFEKLRDEFGKKVKRKQALEDIRQFVERKSGANAGSIRSAWIMRRNTRKYRRLQPREGPSHG